MFEASPWLFSAFIIINIVHAVFWGLETVFTQRFLDAAAKMLEGNLTITGVFIALLSMGLISVGTQIFNGLGNFIPDVIMQKTDGKLSLGIHEKIKKLPAICFEDTDTLDHINKAEGGKGNAIWFTILILLLFTFYGTYFIFISAYLYSLKPELAFAIVLVFIPTALSQIIRTKVFAKLEDASAPIRREYDYYESCMVSREYFKETRLLGGFEYFKKLYLQSLMHLNKLRFKSELKTNLVELSVKVLTIVGYIGVFYMLFVALMQQEISVGAFAAVTNAVGMMYSIMEEIICRHIGSLAQNIGSIENYSRFLELEEAEGTLEEVDVQSDIVLNQVCFTYPKGEKNVLEGVDLTLKHGETLAIVGENGSGKSTLIRLIAGIYLPNQGSVYHGKVDTRQMKPEKLYEHISAVFQKYQRYQLTLKENISIGHMDIAPDEGSLDQLMTLSGLDKNHEAFTQGYDTMLSREFDGIDLSGGQWQRVAIARGLYRPHELIILDEPTAAIDPIEETRIYNQFAEIAKDKTAIIVTHRLGSVKLADRIAVMKEGKLVELGTHDVLLIQDGEYARLYKAQEQWYQEAK